VEFDSSKESTHILSLTEPLGDTFKLLGVTFDGALTMVDAVAEVVNAAGWKLKTLLRTRRFYTDAELILLYKSHLLSFIEYRTPAIYHARRDVLARLDAVQTKFLRAAGVDELTALAEFNLAPSAVRRDIAMLGVIHRTVLGRGAPHFKEFFTSSGTTTQPQRHRYHLVDPRALHKGQLVRRSALGLVAVYNLLPPNVVEASNVSTFQGNLQRMVLECARSGYEEWSSLLSPRVALASHPLA
jgi:hypothetical protein